MIIGLNVDNTDANSKKPIPDMMPVRGSIGTSRLNKKGIGVLTADEPECNAYFAESVRLINQKVGTNVRIKTEKNLPEGDG